MTIKNPQRIFVFLKDKNKKNVFIIFKEVLTLLVRKKEVPFYYFKHLYKKDITNIMDYLGTKEGRRIQIHPELHKAEHACIMDNKLLFSIYAEKFALKTPKLYGHNLKNQFFYDGKMQSIQDEEGLEKFFNLMLISSGVNNVFVKPLSGLGGKGCFKLDLKNLKEQINLHAKSLLSEGHIYSKVVEQHPAIDEIHSKCINTIRLTTFMDNTGKVEIIAPLMRFGLGESVVDNASSGGFWVGIDPENGKLHNIGHRSMEYGGGQLYQHPQSKFRFGGYKIPYYKEACEIVIDALKYIPDRVIGWDVAITPEGPVLIEANTNPALDFCDVVSGGLLKNELIKDLVQKLNKGML